jgi:hypothetical protein
MKTTLYNITTDYLQLMEQVEILEGEITPEMEEQLKINETQLQSKSIAYLEVLKTKEARNLQIDNEIKRLQAMKKANNRISDNLKQRLLDAVKMFGAFEVGLQKFGTRKSTQVKIDIPTNQLPTEFKTVKVTESPNKTAIKDAIKRKEDVTGCELVEVLNLKIN